MLDKDGKQLHASVEPQGGAIYHDSVHNVCLSQIYKCKTQVFNLYHRPTVFEVRHTLQSAMLQKGPLLPVFRFDMSA